MQKPSIILSHGAAVRDRIQPHLLVCMRKGEQRYSLLIFFSSLKVVQCPPNDVFFENRVSRDKPGPGPALHVSRDHAQLAS